MKIETKTVDFFLSTNSPNQFFSLCDHLNVPIKGERRYLIKGSAGGGKSTAMKRIAEAVNGKETLIERVHCSSDPESLDGVILHKGHCSIVDATPPHAVEPEYPASFQTVCDLWSALDEDILTPRLEKLSELESEMSARHKKCRRLLACADVFSSDNRSYVRAHTDFKKIDELSRKLSAKLFPKRGAEGEYRDRLLSAFTRYGVMTFVKTPAALCEKAVLIDDEFGESADRILKSLSKAAYDAGYTVYRCPHPLSPDMLEAVMIPACNIAFVLGNNELRKEYEGSKVIKCQRFVESDALRAKKKMLRFQRKAANTILDSAAEQLGEAKRLHDILEEQYHDGVDFKRVNEQTEKLKESVLKRYTY